MAPTSRSSLPFSSSYRALTVLCDIIVTEPRFNQTLLLPNFGNTSLPSTPIPFQQLMKTNINCLLSTAAFLGAGLVSASGADVAFANGDLILAFQAVSGTGSNKNVFFILGPATSYRDNGNQGLKGNIATTLSTTFGDDWYSRTDLYFGVAGNLNSGPASGFGAIAPVNNDPSRTVYVSRAAASPGTGILYGVGTYSTSALGTAGAGISGVEGIFSGNSSTGGINGGFIAELDGSGILSATNPEHVTAYQNRWSVYNPVPGGAFSTFTGGIQQNFGKGGSATYVDVQRVLATNTGAVPTGVVGGGTYETTIAIGSDGSITALTAGPASAYTTWIGTFPTITAPADKLATADPDNDGFENVLEFVLNGNPSVSSQAILPLLNASGTDFVFSFPRRADSVSEVGQVFEYSVDLSDWTTKAPITIPSAPGASGFVLVGPSTGVAPNQVQAVTITIPKGSETKLFGRLRAIK